MSVQKAQRLKHTVCCEETFRLDRSTIPVLCLLPTPGPRYPYFRSYQLYIQYTQRAERSLQEQRSTIQYSMIGPPRAHPCAKCGFLRNVFSITPMVHHRGEKQKQM